MMTRNTLFAIEQEAKDTFANKWDEIQKVTDLNMGVNRVVEAGV